MGTRADFYVGRGPEAEWLGSIAWDGNPGGVGFDTLSGGRVALTATEEAGYRRAVAEYLAGRDDATVPADGWPWPWKDSNTTDYAYAFEDGAVWTSSFGYPWFRVDLEAPNCGEPDQENEPKGLPFPDMTARQDVTYGPRSGVIVVGFPKSSTEDGALRARADLTLEGQLGELLAADEPAFTEELRQAWLADVEDGAP